LRDGRVRCELDPRLVERGLHPAPGRELALLATIPAADSIDIVGGARDVPAQAPATCEFPVTIADDWRRAGLETRLLRALMRRARRDGYSAIKGLVLAENEPMRALARRLGFTVTSLPDDATVCVARRALWVPPVREFACLTERDT
jgi:acetyltransferase